MNIAHTVEQLSVTRQPVQSWPPTSSPIPVQPPTTHRRDPSSAASVVVALCFLCLFIGVIMFTSYADHGQKSKAHEPARNMPMVHLR